MRLAGKTAAVTGSTKGIGLGIARAFAREGAPRVVINARNVAECAAVAKELSGAIPNAADLSKFDEVRRLARDATQALGGRVDILVNNAGQPRVAPSVGLGEAEYRYTLDLNLNAYFILTQELGRGMLERKSGSTLTAVRPPARFGGLRFDGDLVSEFTEKPQVGEGWINGGFFVMEPGVLDCIHGDETYLERELLGRLANDGQLAAFRHDGFWQCMDTLRDLKLLESLWDSGRAPWKVWCE